MKKNNCFIKRLIGSTFIHLIFILTVMGQAPQSMSYQAVIRDASNNLVKSQAVGIRISILQDSATGAVVYSETQTPSTNGNGLISIKIGGQTGFDTINWADGPYYVKTETDPAGGTSYSITNTSQMLSVPYALYAENAGKNDALKQQIKVIEANLIDSGMYKLIDVDGNQYDVIKIGDQVWMNENLRVTRYADGTPIAEVTDSATWADLQNSDKAYCYYDNDSASYAEQYGVLYTWAAAVNGAGNEDDIGVQGVCPHGWHLPSDKEWQELEMQLGMSKTDAESIQFSRGTNEGSKLAGNAGLWTDGSLESDGEFGISGFNALPGGVRKTDFGEIGLTTSFWTSTNASISQVYDRSIYYNSTNFKRYFGYKDSGYSVRCIKD